MPNMYYFLLFFILFCTVCDFVMQNMPFNNFQYFYCSFSIAFFTYLVFFYGLSLEGIKNFFFKNAKERKARLCRKVCYGFVILFVVTLYATNLVYKFYIFTHSSSTHFHMPPLNFLLNYLFALFRSKKK